MKHMLPIALLACAGCSGTTPADTVPTPVALVALASAEPGALAQSVTLYGIVEGGAGAKAALAAPAEASVAAILAPVGTAVSQGDVIVRLVASPTTRLDLAKATTDARTADAALARARRLRADGLVSDAEVETAKAVATAANLTRTSLAGRTGALMVRAPASGLVESVAVNPGDLVPAGATIATIARRGDLRGRFGVDPAVARVARAGTSLRIEAAAGRAAFAVPIQSVMPVADPQTKLAALFVRLPAAAGLGIGETLTGTLAMTATSEAPAIPYAALLEDGGQPYVYVVAAGVARRRDVAIGATQDGRVAILKGVRRGEQVVTEGGTAIEDGMKVRTK
ncbi:efflux RND transporter periplasmic adaptor subunit [Sphingomonas sp. ERG5]|uniref:efflux RND transporter periplasmic adaptor subunit n=1 Tax=Sphingomonas sp. ERG5 TaxID=1381597 RepID=UPI00054B70A9|nr:efflux RND transporter periplasmic adaptor subunit [Sphingomonas sp. ERG5]